MHVKREIAAVIPPTKSRIQHLYIIVDILMLIICPFQNEIRVGDGVAWFIVLGAGEAMHLNFNHRCHYFLPRRAVDGLCREKKKKTEKGGEKIVMAVYTRLFQIGCGVT